MALPGIESLRNRMRPIVFGKSLLSRSRTRALIYARIELRELGFYRTEFARDKWRLTITLDRAAFDSDSGGAYFIHALPAITHLFANARPGACAQATISDGSWIPKSDISFCANHAESLLVPDPHFFNHQGYEWHRRQISTMPPWSGRSGGFVWRGSSTGRHDQNSPHIDDILAIQRVRFCEKLVGFADTDAKISAIVQSRHPDDDRNKLFAAGLMGEQIPQTEWQNRKFAFDIDGNANTWSNLFVRLLYGCCVIKVASPHGFRQWYYDRLTPWENYVPVAADLHDLHEKIDWCRSHENECRAIAAAGQKLAMGLTFDGEMAAATARINERFGGTQSAAMTRH